MSREIDPNNQNGDGDQKFDDYAAKIAGDNHFVPIEPQQRAFCIRPSWLPPTVSDAVVEQVCNLESDRIILQAEVKRLQKEGFDKGQAAVELEQDNTALRREIQKLKQELDGSDAASLAGWEAKLTRQDIETHYAKSGGYWLRYVTLGRDKKVVRLSMVAGTNPLVRIDIGSHVEFWSLSDLPGDIWFPLDDDGISDWPTKA